MKYFFFFLFPLAALAQKNCDCNSLKTENAGKDHYLDGKLYTGKCTGYNRANKSKVTRSFLNGKYDGETRLWIDDTLVEITLYKAGKRHGASKSFHKNGKTLLEGKWAGNHRSGKWVSYYDNGQVNMINNYEIETAGGYANGWQTGECVQYYPDGKLKTQGAYAYSEYTGTWTEWYENGQKKSEKHYLSGLNEKRIFFSHKNGEWKYWDENGKLTKTENWEANKLIKKQEY